MKKLLTFVALAFILSGVTRLRAEGESRFWVGGGAGALGENSETKTGLIGGGQAGWYWRYLGASAHILHYKADNKVNMLSEGTLSLTPIMFNFFGRIPAGKDVNFRLGGGFSHVSVSHEMDPEVQSFFSSFGFTAKEEVSSGIGAQVLGGADFFITQNLAIGADIIYLFFKPELKATLTRNSTGASMSATTDLKLDAVIGMANLKFYFN